MFLLMVIPAHAQTSGDVYVRVSQVGFLPEDIKSAVIFSTRNLIGQQAQVKEALSGRPVLTVTLKDDVGKRGNFSHHYIVDFSSVTTSGTYVLESSGGRSYRFTIDSRVFNSVVDSVLTFFKAQRCGSTNPILHAPCHLADATRLIEGSRIIRKSQDVAGGWHDAGDYIKFLNTTAFVTYTLLFAYDFDSMRFGFDNDGNGIPDVLDEALIGLSWLQKAAYEERALITQVQDLRDHDQGWRLPECDLLAYDRPAFVGLGKNLIGIYSATFALAHTVWSAARLRPEQASEWLRLAEHFYSLRAAAPDIDSSGSGEYRDIRFRGKLSLAAVELYRATGKKEYLSQAQSYAQLAGSDFWWSWGDVNAYAHYRLAKFDLRFAAYIRANLKAFDQHNNRRIFGEAVVDTWGSNTAILGAALQGILWKDITKDPRYDSLITYQRDFVVGRNPWGLSFISGIGTRSPRSLHSQIAYFNGGKIPGAVAAGPISAAKLGEHPIPYEGKDEYALFQSPSSVYRDDRMDFVTNEPTITTNAVALFVYGYFSRRE